MTTARTSQRSRPSSSSLRLPMLPGRLPPLLILLCVAAAFRLWQIGAIPPGLFGDEAVNGLDALDVLAGRGQAFFPANYGREGFHIFLVALSFLGLGVQAPMPSWGSMILEGYKAMRAEPHMLIAPAATAFGGHWHIFERAAQKSRLQLVQVADITERDGAANTLIYVAQPMKPSFAVPALSDPRNATLARGVVLLGGEVQYDPARREVSVRLYWRSQADALPDDTVLLHIVNQETGEVVLAADTQPVYGAYPFSQWQRGEVVADPHWVTLPDNLLPGTYQVRVGAYDRISGQRRAINDPRHDAAGDSLMLQTFEVR